jgi:glucose dehydrogenase
MDHPGADVVGEMPEPVYPYRGPQNTSGIEAFRDGDSRRRAGAFRMTVGNDGGGRTKSPLTILEEALARGLVGDDLRREVRRRTIRLQRISCSTEQQPLPQNRVTLAKRRDALGLPCPQLTYELDEYSWRALELGKHTAARIMRHVGAEHLQATQGYSGAGHLMGTARMGLDPRSSVVDQYGRCHDHPNMFLVGPAVFPTSSTGNPTLTAAAVTLWTAREVSNE